MPVTKDKKESNMKESNINDSNNRSVNNYVNLSRYEKLISSGWEKKTIIDEPRLSELIELYKSLGFDIHLEPLTQELLEHLGEKCKSCYMDKWDNFKVIYTKDKE